MNNFFKFCWLMIIFTSTILSSCIQAPKNKRTTTTAGNTTATTTTTSTNLPTFTTGNNFFQNGGTTFTGTFTLDIDFADTFYFRGKEVDNYIRNTNSSTPICMISRYTQTSVNKIVVLAMLPKSTYNYTNKSIEYYYSLSPSDQTLNQNYCQKTNLVNKLFSLYPTLTPYYKIKSLCPTGVCASSGYTSEVISLFTNAGLQLTTMNTASLLYYIKNTTTTTTSSGSTCTSNAECTKQGYDCCSGNQCVKDLQKKSGIDETSNEYKQALQDILNSPAKIYNYPQYYYICSSNVTTPTNGSSSTTSDIIKAQQRLNTLASYYNCVNKVHGEYGVCSKTISNATTGVVYSAGVDDRSFATTYSNIDIDTNNLTTIEKVYYGDVLIYDYSTKNEAQLQSSIYTDSYVTINGNHNDDLTTGATVTLNSLPSSAISKDLVIFYKVDSSCNYINSTTAKCEKYYTQGQKNYGSTFAENLMGRVTDHYIATNDFKLPLYANTSKTLKVEVDGVQLIEGVDWNLVSGSPSYVQLISTTNSALRAQDKQVVKITFFASPTVMTSKLEALNAIKTACSCSDLNCNLAPVKNSSGTITDYNCVYPEAYPTTIPVSQKLYLSSKSVPVRFYDSAGASQNTVTADTLQQEGTAFSYTGNDLSKPNNLSSYVGFNEIYGSLSFTTNSAKPPQTIYVKKGTSYDIYVDNGSFATCSQCGADYYSQINKLFPSFTKGGGLSPMQFQSNRIATSSSMVRSDEFAFGRACFVPATMIPWSHYISSDLQTQRQNRLRTQHFLFANGYQRDWYGFDYGAVIGSFDGVKWFAIGTNRRIKATSNKLFIAINGYMGDLTIESTYTVSINDASLNPAGTGMVLTDIDNDGAECQKYHQCTKDSECYARLGPDYVCSSVSEITTSWPVFDDNGNELADATVENNQLISILGIANPGKRCVYRGRGSLCTQNYAAVNVNSTFNKTSLYDFHACSPNNYCQTFAGATSLNSNFNNRINRYGKVVADSTRDSFGLGAPITMRPYDFNGQETIRTETLHNLSATKAVAMCIPGKDPEQTNYVAQNSTKPDPSAYPGDRVIGLGQTQSAVSGTGNDYYLAACGTFDSSGNYYYKQSSAISSENVVASGAQNIPANALYRLKTILDGKGLSSNIFSSPTSILSSLSIQQNSCLRAPGASCNTDLECAPSKPITDKIKLLTASDTTITSQLNEYEIKFWQEPLICSQSAAKTAATFDPRDNKCCRDVGNTISIGQKSPDPTHPGYNLLTSSALGIVAPLNNQYRYSRVSTYFKEYIDDSSTYPSLSIPMANQCTNSSGSAGCYDAATLKNQFNTINLLGKKTSCTDNWVRSFADGTHVWNSNKFQSFNSTTFRCFNWLPNNVGNWSCAGLTEDDPRCTIVQTSPSSSKAKAILSFLGKLELLGIPQVTLPVESKYISDQEKDLSCKSNPNNQADQYYGDTDSTTNETIDPPVVTNVALKAHTPTKVVVSNTSTGPTYTNYTMTNVITQVEDWYTYSDYNSTGLDNNGDTVIDAADNDRTQITRTRHTFVTTSVSNYFIPPFNIWSNFTAYTYDPTSVSNKREVYDSSTSEQLYSAIDTTNFNAAFKKIFKADEIVSCLPAGSTVSSTSEANKCCTGFINEKTMKCALDNFVDLSVYTNKYVSSEGSSLSSGLFDEDGYIKDPSYVAQLACAKNMCASGKVAYGVLISNLKIPGLESSSTKIYRFMQANATADDANGLLTIYNLGLKLNNHAYCVPSSTNGGQDITVISCSGN